MGFHVTTFPRVILMGHAVSCTEIILEHKSVKNSRGELRQVRTALMPFAFHVSPSHVGSPESSFT